MVDFGGDISGVTDLSANMREVSGESALVEAAARRLSTSAGRLFYAQDYGYDLRRFINADPRTKPRIESQAETELVKDERIDGADVDVTFLPDAVPPALTLEITLTPSEGPTFAFTLNVTATTFAILHET